MEAETKDKTCGTCNFCIKDDGFPYCVMKDLYTQVDLKDKCDELDWYGKQYWVEEKGDKK